MLMLLMTHGANDSRCRSQAASTCLASLRTQQRNSVRFMWESKSSFLMSFGRGGDGNKIQFCGVSSCQSNVSFGALEMHC